MEKSKRNQNAYNFKELWNNNINLQERSQMKITIVSGIVVGFATVYGSRIQILHPIFLTTTKLSYKMTYKTYALSRQTFFICLICSKVFNCCNRLKYF